MNITLYSNFSKRVNSTKQPTGAGTSKTCVLKENTSIERPVFQLSGGLSSYEGVSAVQWGSRYYYVSDIRSAHNGITEIECDIDRGATFKAGIVGSTQFVERCADISFMSTDIRDEMCVPTDKAYIVHFAPAGQLFPQATLTRGIIAVRLSNNAPTSDSGGSSSIVYLDAQTDGSKPITTLMQAFYSSGVIEQLKNTIVSPLDCIISCTYIPGITTDDLLALRNGANQALYDAPNTSLVFGNHSYGTLPRVECVAGRGPYVYSKTIEVSVEGMMKYPIFPWRNLAPFAKWSLYLPFFGTVPIPAEEYINVYDETVPEANRGYFTMLIKMTLDLTSGELVYMRYKRHHAVGGTTTDIPAQEYRTTIGTPVAISSAQQNIVKFGSDIALGVGGLVAAGVGIASGGTSAVLGGLGAAVAGSASAAHDISSQIMSTAGSFNANGTQISASQVNQIVLIQEGLEPQESPTDHASTLGYPCMKQIPLSSISGFVQCRNAHVDIAGTEEDKEAVNSMLNNGIFIE